MTLYNTRNFVLGPLNNTKYFLFLGLITVQMYKQYFVHRTF